ncbi:nitroreductase [Chitinophaga sp. Mgbs1]|uniref:Nitroreductase n=1 Tax=Chitinophaga solisilvae TaxID=1233460 RepID=A0A433WPS7_9BACT|nr:nitroreductase [Chitinophaga solisilvae]
MMQAIDTLPETGDMMTHLIRGRRSIYADAYTGEEIPAALLEEILINATWAPTHKMTEPWRFVAMMGAQRAAFGSYLEAWYRDYYQQRMSAEAFAEKQHYLLQYPLKAACMIGIVLVKSEQASLPEWEEIAAIASAVQNMALSCTSRGIGSYWDSGAASVAYVASQGLAANEQSLGIFFMGYPEVLHTVPRKKRTPAEQKITWLT